MPCVNCSRQDQLLRIGAAIEVGGHSSLDQRARLSSSLAYHVALRRSVSAAQAAYCYPVARRQARTSNPSGGYRAS